MVPQRGPARSRSAISAKSAITTIEAIGETPSRKGCARRPGSARKSCSAAILPVGTDHVGRGRSMASNPHPSDSDMNSAMSGNICPLRHLCAHPLGHQAGSFGDHAGRHEMILDHLMEKSGEATNSATPEGTSRRGLLPCRRGARRRIAARASVFQEWRMPQRQDRHPASHRMHSFASTRMARSR